MIGDQLDAIVEDCGGYILGTGPRRDQRGKVLRDGGEWDPVRALPPRVLRGLVAAGMAGRVRPQGATLPAGLRGVPTDPSTLAWAIVERGNGPGELDAAQAVEWFVGRVHAVRAISGRVDEDRRAEPDPLPAWCTAWLARMVCDRKRAFALEAARSVYWGDDYGYPEPESTGATWEHAVWRKLGNRHVAEHNRHSQQLRKEHAS